MANDDAIPDTNPLEFDARREHRIRERAYHLWDADGRPHGRDLDYWERARELEAITENPTAGLEPIETVERADEASLEENLGEFPGRLTDQGDRPQTPTARTARAASARGPGGRVPA